MSGLADERIKTLLIALLLSAYPLSCLSAQCPNGSPPPCQGAARPVLPDAGRIAVLPFRVSAELGKVGG